VQREDVTTAPDRRVLAAEATEEAARPEETVEVRFEDAGGSGRSRQARRR
jgi:hypothetical protein